MIILLIFAFIAGFITILSPCILSIAPLLLATSASGTHYKPLGIITGFVTSFSFFTLATTAIVEATGISPDIFRYIALTVIILFGLTMVIPWLENKFTIMTSFIAQLGSSIEKKVTIDTSSNSAINAPSAGQNTGNTESKNKSLLEFFTGLIIGIALGLIWTPCAGPILATITVIAATKGITLTTIAMTLSYSLGAAIPMLLISFGGTKIIQSTTAFAPYAHTIRQIFGVIIIISALAMIFHVDTFIQEKIAHLFPTLNIEKSSRLQKELNMLKKTNTSGPARRSLGEGRAPELVGIADWINSKPLTLAQLKGKVVLLDFWTYSCINCVRTLPHIMQWYKEYKDKGLEIIGVHTPEFAFEKNKQHVEDAVKRFNITYPVALDNNYQTWQTYDNHYWPAHYLINQDGMIVKTHFGEGDYVEMENAIRALLNMHPLEKKGEFVAPQQITPETYLGFERGDRYNPSLQIQKNKAALYQPTEQLGDDQVDLKGNWIVAEDHIHSEKDNSKIILNFIATHVYLVMQSDKPQQIMVFLDGKKEGTISVHEPRMYDILDLKNNYGRHTLTLQCPKDINAYVFTFGGEDK
jgi:cytochrome c biogenesis protein CcdA/thiol-disulfide isomerase/thioredoxin